MEAELENKTWLAQAGWRDSTLGEACELIMGQSPPSSAYNDKGNGLPFFQGKTEFGDLHPVAVKWCTAPNKIAEPGDVLLSVRAPVGPTNLADQQCCIGRGLSAVRPLNGTLSKFVLYYLRSIEAQIDELGTGTTFKAVSGKVLRELPFPLAPLPEQRRIVQAIETQLGRLDAAVARLQAAKARLKRYKQAVLKAAVEGPLENGDYEWITIEEASERIVDCLHSTPKFTEHGKYCIDTTCIEQGVIRFDKARFVTEDSYTDRIRRLKPEAGDVLFAREGTVGTTVVVPEDVDLCLGQRMMMFRLKKDLLPEFFMYVMQSAIMVDKYRPLIMGTTAPHLNIRDIKKFTLPKYPVALQRQIVARLDGTFEVLREQDSTLDAQLLQAGRLRQAVLKRAFEGRLVGGVTPETP